jgi:hypothetical protein
MEERAWIELINYLYWLTTKDGYTQDVAERMEAMYE